MFEECTNIDQLTRGGHWRHLVDAGWWHCSGWSWPLTPVHAEHLDRTHPAHIDMLSLIYYPTFNTLLVGDIISLSLGHMVGEICNGQSVTSQSRNSPGYLQKERDKESVSMSDPTGKTLLFLMNSRLFFLVLQSYSRIRAFIINVINDYR